MSDDFTSPPSEGGTVSRPSAFSRPVPAVTPPAGEFEAKLEASIVRDPLRFSLAGMLWLLFSILLVISPALVIALWRVLL